MRYPIVLLMTVAFIAAFVLSGCDSSSNEIDTEETTGIESNQNMEITANEEDEEIRVYRLENADRFREFNRTTTELEQQIENESDDEVRARLETKLDEHAETQRELKREIDNFQASESDNWDEFKDSFSNRMDDLGDSLNDFFSTENTNTSSIN